MDLIPQLNGIRHPNGNPISDGFVVREPPGKPKNKIDWFMLRPQDFCDLCKAGDLSVVKESSHSVGSYFSVSWLNSTLRREVVQELEIVLRNLFENELILESDDHLEFPVVIDDDVPDKVNHALVRLKVPQRVWGEDSEPKSRAFFRNLYGEALALVLARQEEADERNRSLQHHLMRKKCDK